MLGLRFIVFLDGTTLFCGFRMLVTVWFGLLMLFTICFPVSLLAVCLVASVGFCDFVG